MNFFREETLTIGIAGLGIIGGSFAKAIKAYTPHYVLGFDLNEHTLLKAKEEMAIDDAALPQRFSECDIVFLALYPKDAIEFVKAHLPALCKGCILVDLCGVKRCVAEAIYPLCAQAGVIYIGGHPMAGRERWGFDSSDKALYQNASMILTPFPDTPPKALTLLQDLCADIGFGKLNITTPEDHDSMIAFTSQLAHIVSSAYIKSPRAQKHKGYSAGSYRDLTRVARLNPDMWTELFLENKDDLVNEIDTIMQHLKEYRDVIEKGDYNELYRLLDEGRAIKEALDYDKN